MNNLSAELLVSCKGQTACRDKKTANFKRKITPFGAFLRSGFFVRNPFFHELALVAAKPAFSEPAPRLFKSALIALCANLVAPFSFLTGKHDGIMPAPMVESIPEAPKERV